MNLNKISVLDKGYISLLSASNSDNVLQQIQREYFNNRINKQFLDIATATIQLKCPIFMQLQLSQYGLDIIQLPKAGENEFYYPDVSDIKSGDTEIDSDISKHIASTSEALSMGIEAMEEDGCSGFISQILTPVNMYVEIIAHGSVRNWLKFLKRVNAPIPVSAYRIAIEDVLKAEWKDIDFYKKE